MNGRLRSQWFGLTGPSGSGKTSLARRLTRTLVAQGATVSYVKATHHEINDDPERGDTGRLLRAGALEAFLAQGNAAVRFAGDKTCDRLQFDSPEELIGRASGEVVLIEGWAEKGAWPRLSVSKSGGDGDLTAYDRSLPRILERLGRLPKRRRFTGMIFDLDGTLVDSWDALQIAVNDALKVLNRPPISREEIISSVGEGVEKLMQRCLGSDEAVPREANEAFLKRYDEECCNGSRPLENVVDVLEELSNQGIMMSVCTNKPSTFSKRILDALELSPYLRAVIGPDTAGELKPSPVPVRKALETLELPPEEVLFVGDMPVDVAAARAAGLAVAALPTGSATHEMLVESDPDHLLESFEELLDHV